MIPFAQHVGTWHGSNDFRLMPTDPPHSAPCGATVVRAAGGNLATLTYNWAHPDDSEQSGQLVVGPAEEPGSVVAFWGDSWHQHPSPRLLLGTLENGVVDVGYEYEEGWWWRIIIDLTAENALRLRMDNVVPESAGDANFVGGAYSAMVATFMRTVS
jgi:hypothetical protein